jgi:HEPN domain-containing protein
MTKTEVREWIRRIREDLRDAEAALRNGDGDALVIAMQDASGAAAEIETAAINGDINGLDYVS